MGSEQNTETPAHRFLNSVLLVNSQMHFFRICIISAKMSIEKIRKKSSISCCLNHSGLRSICHSRTVPACNCRGTDRRKMKVKQMPF